MSKENYRKVLVLAALFFMTALPCHAETVLERAMKVDDPELGACIRFALERQHERYSSGEDRDLELIRKVTELYTEIKLQDTQIRHLQRQLNQPDGSSTIRHELILAQSELESRRELAFAQLRQVMYIIPRHHMGKISTEQLKSHLTVDVVDSNDVWIYRTGIPPSSRDFTFVEKASLQEMQQCVERIVVLAKQTPTRIDIRSYAPHSQIASALRDKLKQAVIQKRLELDVDLRLTIHSKERGLSTLQIVRGQIVTGSSSSRSGRKVRSSWDPSDSSRLDAELQRHLDPRKGPGLHPKTLRIEYCQASKEVADMIAEKAKAMVKKLGMESWLTIELEPTKAKWIE
ncbi:MAG: hypothetical protein ACYTE3_16970 [Planctomycetota bacterium]|jgi:hypothetical protein